MGWRSGPFLCLSEFLMLAFQLYCHVGSVVVKKSSVLKIWIKERIFRFYRGSKNKKDFNNFLLDSTSSRIACCWEGALGTGCLMIIWISKFTQNGRVREQLDLETHPSLPNVSSHINFSTSNLCPTNFGHHFISPTLIRNFHTLTKPRGLWLSDFSCVMSGKPRGWKAEGVTLTTT